MIKLLLIINLVFILLFNNSCSPTGVLASGGATTMVIAEGDRSLGTVVDDATIKVKIASKFLSSEENLFLNVEATVIEGRVLLTGIVNNQQTRINAVRKVWEVEGVNEVINEIEIGDKTTLKEYSKDLWINTRVRGVAAKNIGLKALSYNFETIRGKLYIAGITSNKEELDLLIKSIMSVKGVEEIVNYVIFKE